MSTTSDLITTAVLIAPGALLSIPVAISQRGARADSAAVRQALAASAAERAARTTATTETAPPDGGEGAPAPAVEAAARLATVHQLPSARRAA
ncbi:hypothetical protein P3T27_002042 [Kitasatospora sp. MAA19]|uniref:hypothetical protein n=1 Tax=Kitasatospora sp. MAA19 TaxID=3035090 RepID=UPI002475BD35|nr:hypothetical protein [Kitasatospora sp. MAA19]MDH6705332.1 hypothetical protein [Kitasatospora sp. MAA19]